MKRIFSTAGITSRGYRDSDMLFELTSTPTQRVTASGGSSVVTSYDESVTRYTSATTITEGIIDVAAPIGYGIEWTNLTPGIATFNETTRQLTRVSSGTSKLNAKIKGRIKQVTTPISSTSPTTTDIPLGFANGTLAENSYTQVYDMVEGEAASSATQNFLNEDGTRNASIWASNIDLSCIITAHSGGWQQGCVIAPRFAIMATHVGTSAGQTYTCRTNAGVAVTRTVVAAADLGGDLLLVQFDSDFTDITPAKILPANFATYYKPNQKIRKSVPVLKWKRVGGMKLGIGIGNGSTGVSYTRPAEFADWYIEWQGGDSGSPVGQIINGDFTFLGNAWTGPGLNDDGSSFLADKHSQLVTAMNTMVSGSSSTLTYPDMEGLIQVNP